MSQSISRRSFLRAAALTSAALASRAKIFGQPGKLPRKPNLLVFLPDQLRPDTITSAGSNAVHAPNMHKLAAQSSLFEHAYVTQPICVPSRSSIFTGTWPHVNGAVDNQHVLPLKYPCLPEMLGDSDYRTGYFGKWHLGDELSAQRGFQEWISTEEYPKSASGEKIKGQCDYTKFLLSKGYKPHPKRGQTFDRNMVSKLPFELSKPKFLETKACEFLQRHRDEPFILFVAFYEPHPPYNGPFNSEHPLESVALDSTAEETFSDDVPLRYRLLQEQIRKRVGAGDKLRQIKQKYFGLINEIDRCIGTILAKVDDLGLNDRTTVVLTSDHGDMMSAHGLLGKRVMFEQSASVPYLVRVPAQRPLRCAQPVSHIDFAPTMLDLLGKAAPEQCAGRSRVNLIRGETAPPELVFTEWCRSLKDPKETSNLASREEVNRAVSESTRALISPDGWKLCLRDQDKNELYNLRDDPEERRNLFYGGLQRPLIENLTGEIHRWQERTADTLKV
jgi:arylsulfatase